jgi:hypothetical protein
MPTSAAEILETFVETLRASGKFRLVTLGEAIDGHCGGRYARQRALRGCDGGLA